MDSTKSFQTEIFKCRNVYADIFIPVNRRPEHRPGVHHVLFARQVGILGTADQEKAKLKMMLDKLKALKAPVVIIEDKLKFQPEQALIQHVKMTFKEPIRSDSDIKNGIETLINSQVLNLSSWKIEKKQVALAIHKTVQVYLKYESSINNSKVINFLVKLLSWMKVYLSKMLSELSERIDNLEINPKCLHANMLNGQECYFLFLCRYMGIDTVHFSFNKEDKEHFVEAYDKQTQVFVYSNFAESIKLQTQTVSAPAQPTQQRQPIQNQRPQVQRPQVQQNRNAAGQSNAQRVRPAQQTSNRPTPKPPKVDITRPIQVRKKDFKSHVLIKNKRFEGELDAVLSALKDRAGYAGEPSPILPTYFVRYIGTQANISVYKNNLYRFNSKCKSDAPNYIMMNGGLTIGNYMELNKKSAGIWPKYTVFIQEDMKELVAYLKGADFLSFLRDEDVKEQGYTALHQTLKLAFHGGNQVPSSKVKNIVIKLAGWLMDYGHELLRGFSYENAYNPTILYYGEIKAHEALFLVFAYNIGVDVVYINTFDDEVFEALDPAGDFSTVHVLDTVKPLFDFPESESLVQHDTVAHQASMEIAEIIHNEQDGVYKPWQFESYKVMPVTLRTTFDEVFLLWNEDARIRAGFKVENKTVYVPNLFTKISGTHDDLTQYWKEVLKLTDASHSELYTRLPFTEIQFDKQDLYAMDMVFDNHTTLNFEKLTQFRAYKYAHLSSHLQNMIFEKLNMLINSDLIKINDEMLRLKVVHTILNLDDNLLRMIQNFDYPAAVPKIVIYDSDEATFSEADAITMAFLYLIGFDICVLTPTGYNNFEMYINEDYYRVFKLTQKQFNLNLPDLNRYRDKTSKGFWAGLFG